MFTEAFLHDFRLNYGCKLEDAVCDFLSFFVVLLNQTGGLSVTMCNAFTLRDYAAQLFGVEIASGYSLFAKLLSLTLFESSLSLVHACVKRSR